MTPREQREAMIGELLVERTLKRLKIIALAADIDKSPQVISAWEKMKINPSAPALFEWANALGFDVVLRRKEST